MTASDRIALALSQALEQAPQEARKALYDAIAEYQAVYGRTYSDVRKQPFARKMLDAIVDATEF